LSTHDAKVERAVPCAVVKIQAAKPQLFGIVWRSSRSTFKNRTPDDFRTGRDLIQRKVNSAQDAGVTRGFAMQQKLGGARPE
jgi:hypothetical protein